MLAGMLPRCFHTILVPIPFHVLYRLLVNVVMWLKMAFAAMLCRMSRSFRSHY